MNAASTPYSRGLAANEMDLREAQRISAFRLPIEMIALGMLIRAVLAPYTSWAQDDAVWMRASLSGYYGVPLYQQPGFSYPPVWGYVLQLIGALVRVVGLGPEFFGLRNPDLSSASVTTGDFSDLVTSPAYNVMFKTVLFGIDLATGLVIFRLVGLITRDHRMAKLAFGFWFLNPFVIYESAIHGGADNLVGMCVIAAIALVLSGGAFWGGAAWVLGILTKLTPVALALDFVVALLLQGDRALPRLGRFLGGSGLAAAVLLAPLVLSDSIRALVTNVSARAQAGVFVGGLSVFGLRHLRPFADFGLWAYENPTIVNRFSELAAIVAILGWTAWTFVLMRRMPAFALLSGTTGTLASLMLVAPLSQPQYVLWWLPGLVAIVAITGRGYVQLVLLSIAPLIFTLGILGPASIFAPLATYSHVVSSQTVADSVSGWYLAPGRLWGASLQDDFYAPATLITIASLLSLFWVWVRLARSEQDSRRVSS